MGDFKVVEGGDKVGAWAIKYNSLVDEVIESVNTVDDGANVTITYNKIGGGTFVSKISKSNIITGKTHNELYDLSFYGNLIPGMYYELNYNTIDVVPNVDVIFTGATETLLLFAISKTSFHQQVLSKSFPQDIIYYDFNNNGFNTPNNPATRFRPGYIYYRHDTIRNIKVRGYDFRSQVFYRYPVDRTNYNQYNAGLAYSAGAYVWYSSGLYVFSKNVGAGQVPDIGNSVNIIGTQDFYLTSTGATNYGTTVLTNVSLYPVLTGVTSGYTFSQVLSTNNYEETFKNITIDSFYSYNGWKPSYNYNSTDYTHKSNLVMWGSTCSNGSFTDTVTDVTIIGSLNNFSLDSVNNLNFISGSYSNIEMKYVSNSVFYSTIQNSKFNYCNNLLLTNTTISSLVDNSRFSYIGNNTSSKLYDLNYSTILNACVDNIINKFYYSKLWNSSTNNIFNNVSNSFINGTYNTVSDSNNILVGIVNGTSPYETSSYNIIQNSSNINLYGGNNNIYNCTDLGTSNGAGGTTGGTSYLFSTNSTYKSGCANFSTYLSAGQINGCTFGENTSNIRLLNHNIGLTNCSFAPGTKNISFGTDTGNNFRPYANITTSLPYSGIKVSPLRTNITIRNIDINNKNFVGLNETNDLVAISFTGGTTPVYTSIESYI